MRTVSVIPGPNQAAIVIYDGNKLPLPDANQDGFKPAATCVEQLSQVWRAPFQAIYPRFNHTVTWEFTVIHSFTTLQACQDFVGNRAAVIPDSGELVILTRGAQGLFTRYVKSVLVKAPVIQEDLGISVAIRYGLIWAGPYSTTP
jgi:hypothetical protein